MAKGLQLSFTHASFSLPKPELEKTYFTRCERICEEIRGAWLNAQIARLLKKIAIAFRGVPRPRITLHVARGYDDEWVLPEERAQKLSAIDPEQSWEEVSDETILSFQEYFTFSDAEGWRFYLPAYMSFYLREFQRTGSASNNEPYWSCVRRDHVELLTPEQLECVTAFVALANEVE